MVVTIDTNVLFEAFYSKRGASFQIVRLIRHGDLSLAISIPVFEEYRDVLSRKENKVQLKLTDSKINTILQFIATVGHPTKISYLWRPNLRDEADNMVFELAIASSSQYLITKNIRDFTQDTDLGDFDLRIVTPHNFMRRWSEQYGK